MTEALAALCTRVVSWYCECTRCSCRSMNFKAATEQLPTPCRWHVTFVWYAAAPHCVSGLLIRQVHA